MAQVMMTDGGGGGYKAKNLAGKTATKTSASKAKAVSNNSVASTASTVVSGPAAVSNHVSNNVSRISTGFNERDVRNALGGIISSWGDLCTCFHVTLQRTIDGVSSSWACDRAVSFFERVKTSVDNLSESAAHDYQTAYDTIKNAYQDWVRTSHTANSGIPLLNHLFPKKALSVDVSSIKSISSDGLVGADISILDTTSNKISVIKKNVDSALQSAVNAVNNCGFSDDKQMQQEACKAMLERTKASISYLMDGIVIAMRHEISETIRDFESVTMLNANKFIQKSTK